MMSSIQLNVLLLHVRFIPLRQQNLTIQVQ